MVEYLELVIHKFEKTQLQLGQLIRQMAQPLPPRLLLTQSLKNLATALEEVRVLAEVIATQHDKLQVTQSTLSSERQQYFELFNLAPDGYIVTDHCGIIEQINLTAASLLNRHQGLCLGKPLIVLVATAERPRFYTLLNRLQKGNALQNIELCLQPYQRQPLYANFTIAVVRNYQEEIVGFRWLFRDLTRQRQAAMTLKESEQRYASLAAAVPVGIFRTDRTGNCIYVNKRWCEIAGLSSDAATGEGWSHGIHPDDRDWVVAEWTQSVQKNQPFQLEYRFQRPNGQVTWVYEQSVAEQNLDGQVIGYVGTVTDISALKQAQALLAHNALHDPLTHLPNRTLLLDRLALTINKAQRQKNFHYAVLFLDLDRFKIVNDSLGHVIGDQLLTEIAAKLESHLRDIDIVARLGGDEFVILLEGINGSAQVVQVAERILADSQTPFIIDGHEIFTSFSIGIVLGATDYHQASDLIRDADIAMYCAKAQGKNSYHFFNASMHKQALSRLTLETAIRKALEQEEFTVYYQPIFRVSDNCLVGFEALIRWQHPTLGLVLPNEFVPVAEEMGLMVSLDNWVCYRACQQMVRWQTQFMDRFPLKMSINLTTQGLHNTRSVQKIDEILADTGLTGDLLSLEITESMLIKDIDQTIDILDQLASRNIQISIDDFGTGYSSLNYLHCLPVHTLKIDGSFVRKMQVGNRNYQVVNTIITLSNQLGLSVVAEGIEMPWQLQQLQKLGCKLGQGNLFSKPLTAHDIEAQFFTSVS